MILCIYTHIYICIIFATKDIMCFFEVSLFRSASISSIPISFSSSPGALVTSPDPCGHHGLHGRLA